MSGNPDARAVIGEMVRRIVAAYRPERIILFGSYAYGRPDDDSDIDLLIVKETDERLLDRMATVRELVTGAHPRIPFEPIVLTPGELDQRLRRGDQFLKEIIERGEILFAA